jgi:hypothetical protein
MKTDLVVLRNYESEIPATMAKMVLEGSGIDSMIRKDDCGGMRPYLQAATGVQLLVRRENAEHAQDILKHSEENGTGEAAEPALPE